MRNHRWSISLAAVVVIAACGTDDSMPETVDDAAQPAEAMAEPEHVMSVEMVGLDGSTAGGTVSINLDGDQPTITVALRNAGTGVHQGHIHGGTCAERTRAITPLQPVTTDETGSGEATSTVDMPAATLADGQHIVVYHEAGGSPGASIVCAGIPAH